MTSVRIGIAKLKVNGKKIKLSNGSINVCWSAPEYDPCDSVAHGKNHKISISFSTRDFLGLKVGDSAFVKVILPWSKSRNEHYSFEREIRYYDLIFKGINQKENQENWTMTGPPLPVTYMFDPVEVDGLCETRFIEYKKETQ